MLTPQQIRAFSGVKMNVEVELGRLSLSMRQILELRTGRLIALDRALGDNLTLRIGGQEVGEGEIVLVEQQMGLRIAQFLPLDGVPTKRRNSKD